MVRSQEPALTGNYRPIWAEPHKTDSLHHLVLEFRQVVVYYEIRRISAIIISWRLLQRFTTLELDKPLTLARARDSRKPATGRVAERVNWRLRSGSPRRRGGRETSMQAGNSGDHGGAWASLNLKKLSPDQVRRIDEMLVSLGDYGELHLIVQHGDLRYINKVESYKAWDGKDAKPAVH